MTHTAFSTEEWLERIFEAFFTFILKFLNTRNTDPKKRMKGEKNMEENESHGRKEKTYKSREP